MTSTTALCKAGTLPKCVDCRAKLAAVRQPLQAQLFLDLAGVETVKVLLRRIWEILHFRHGNSLHPGAGHLEGVNRWLRLCIVKVLEEPYKFVRYRLQVDVLHADYATARYTEMDRMCPRTKIATRRPGRSTRWSSARARSLSATFRSPYPMVAASKLLSSNGSFIASPCLNHCLHVMSNSAGFFNVQGYVQGKHSVKHVRECGRHACTQLIGADFRLLCLWAVSRWAASSSISAAKSSPTACCTAWSSYTVMQELGSSKTHS